MKNAHRNSLEFTDTACRKVNESENMSRFFMGEEYQMPIGI